MSVNFALHGLDRVGRMFLRAWFELDAGRDGASLAAVVGDIPGELLAYLLRHDSTQGPFPGTVSGTATQTGSILIINGHEIPVFPPLRVEDLPWHRRGMDLVVDCEPRPLRRGRADDHLRAGARCVVVTAPSADAELTVLPGINLDQVSPDRHRIVYCAVPSTHALATMVQVLVREGFGVEVGHLTTLRSEWPDQVVVDSSSSQDWRGGRAAGINIIPETSGAAQWVEAVLPEVKGRLAGYTLLVPSAIVSVADFTVRTAKATRYEDISAAMKRASETYLNGILGYTRDHVVSRDSAHGSESCVFDDGAGLEVGDRTFKLIGWYDNEWSHACRMCETVAQVASRLRGVGR